MLTRMMTSRRKPWKTLALIALFLAAFLPRAVYPVSRPVQWYERSYRFVEAVLAGRWGETVLSEHPGVSAMWLVGLVQHGWYGLQQALGRSPAHPLDIAGRPFATEVAVSVVPLALAIAAGVMAAWWLLRELFGEEVAWAGAGLLALDPFHIAISKVVHIDALLSVLMLLSALTLLVYLKRREEGEHGFGVDRTGLPEPVRSGCRRREESGWLVASGVLGGLAFLTKSPSYFLVPFVGLGLLVAGRRKRLVQGYVVPAVVWGAAAAVTYVALWPAMWVEPKATLATVLGWVSLNVGRAHPQPLYYLGELVQEDPGLGYYGVTLLVKTTAVSLPLLAVGLVSPLASMWRRERRWLGMVVAYLVFFVVQMGMGAKKMPR